MSRVLVVDDEEGIRAFVGEVIEMAGHEVTCVGDGGAAAELLDRHSYHLMITDLRMPRLDGMSLLRKARAERPEMEVIVMTAYGSIDGAVEAMKLGAFDYLQKPISGPAELRLLASRALERAEARALAERVARSAPAEPHLTFGASSMAPVVRALKRVASTDATVLLLGESGVGKEVAARALHRQSRRAEAAFVAVNCAALPDRLVASALFGHERGAFTGAERRQRGLFELADGGTLFLDEIGELRSDTQVQLLRVLQERQIRRLGSERMIDVDVRIVAATHRDLPPMIAEGTFRADLYHRLAVFPVELPPLRKRRGDIGPLAEWLLEHRVCPRVRRRLGLSREAIAWLVDRRWPGNIRELANALERAAILADGAVIGVADLAGPLDPPAERPRTLAETERAAIEHALAHTDGHRKQAAELLGIGLRTLYEKIRRYGISRP